MKRLIALRIVAATMATMATVGVLVIMAVTFFANPSYAKDGAPATIVLASDLRIVSRGDLLIEGDRSVAALVTFNDSENARALRTVYKVVCDEKDNCYISKFFETDFHPSDPRLLQEINARWMQEYPNLAPLVEGRIFSEPVEMMRIEGIYYSKR